MNKRTKIVNSVLSSFLFYIKSNAMRKLKKTISIICFQIGVNIIGVPQIIRHYAINEYKNVGSKYHA